MARLAQAAGISVIALSLVFCAPAGAVSFAGGTGEPNNPYRIATAQQLFYINSGAGLLGKCFLLVADVNLTGRPAGTVAPIGSWLYPFTGVFDGGGHTISGFAYSTSADVNCVGLFACLNGTAATLRNLTLAHPAVDANNALYVGALLGALEEGSVVNCHVTGGSVCGKQHVGGLVGAMGMTWRAARVAFGSGLLSMSHADAAVSAEAIAGGLVGNINAGRMVTDCNSTGTVVTGAEGFCAGGLIGAADSATVTRCFSAANVTAGTSSESVGGLVGEQTGQTLDNCYAAGRVFADSKSQYIGGCVGHLSSAALVNCYAMGDVSTGKSSQCIGGLVGGNHDSSITCCYSAGAVSSSGSYVGGLVGSGSTTAVTQSFWDRETSGRTTSKGGTGKTTAVMQRAKTFLDAHWDFTGEKANGIDDFWTICEGKDYPRLSWEDRKCPAELSTTEETR